MAPYTFPLTPRAVGSRRASIYIQALPNVHTAFTGEKVLLADLTTQASYPVAKVFLDSPLFIEEAEIAIKKDPLPISGVQLLLGNDLAGSQVVPSPRVVDTPVKQVQIEQNNNIFPSCAVTRSQSAKNMASPPSTSVTPSENLYNEIISKEDLIKSTRNRCFSKFHQTLSCRK